MTDEHFERALLQRAVASSKNGVTIGRASQGKFPLIYANAAFCEMTGYAPKEVIGKNCSFLQNGQSDQPGLKILRAALTPPCCGATTARMAARSGMNSRCHRC